MSIRGKRNEVGSSSYQTVSLSNYKGEEKKLFKKFYGH
ncbi:hypothetical protein MC28_G390 (plasmid) [Bacillus thuringiensis MC28]|nr:hypothetical protein MC28_G390 [Bacillus thuringiensis MC28]